MVKNASIFLARFKKELTKPRLDDGALSSILGEIIVGKNALPGVVTQSQQTYDRLYERLKKAWQRGTTVHLTIHG